jgi:hypothetical protein
MALFLATAVVKAQDKEKNEDKGFKKENLFTGGSITLSFFNGQTVLGANPMFGYRIAEWIDAGIALNYVYTSYRDYLMFDDKIRQTTFGPGVFTRIYPFNFFFVQGQFEHNFITQKYFPANDGETQKYKTGINSLLLGGGIAQGREEGSGTFYYISVLFDVLKDPNSPYVNVSYNPNDPSQQQIRLVPIIRAGINIGLFQGKYR